MKFEYKKAEEKDIPILGVMNKKLIEDEGHSNPMSIQELTDRMADFLKNSYSAYLIKEYEKEIGYCLYIDQEDYIYIRQLFIERDERRKGKGKHFVQWLKQNIWIGRKLRIEVLIENIDGIEFWKKIGFHEYCMTMEWK